MTLAELEYGIHRKGQPVHLRNALVQVLLRIDVLPWDEAVATCYGAFCATLVSRDKAFTQVTDPRLALEIW